MRVGKGPHEGRQENLGGNVRVVVDPEMYRQIKRLIAQHRNGKRLSYSSAVRRLTRAGLESGAAPSVIPNPQKPVIKTIRFESDLLERLHAIAKEQDRDTPFLIRGFMAVALREGELQLAS